MLNSQAGRVRRASLATAAEWRLIALLVLTNVGVIAVAAQVDPPPWMHSIALFAHLAALVVGFGSVLAVDWYGVLYLARRLSMSDVLVQAERMSPVIWLGLVVLVASGAFLQPQIGSLLTMIKMIAVIGISVVGVLTLALKRRMMWHFPDLPRPLLLRGMILAAASQSLWWTAVIIGFLNAQA